ncbi:MAG: hypothetical protein Q7T36_13130 [Fluviicoccus sp.]|uniref:hypothetical protein n=1 Tax=Fluviicoccus sp. TaxID=2003552 RepID=UPI002723C3FB|nr:hypothetical protein [Fluviicoccus sp.]MDO8331401.1 hypothetical protein [Fluviicoccus sp.]
MPFVERIFYENSDFPRYRRLLGVSGKIPLVTPQGWFFDEERGIDFFELGGRGEMPESTGAPPNNYILLVDSSVYKIQLRWGRGYGGAGGLIYRFSVESIDFPADNRMSKDVFYSLLREALFSCEQARLKRAKSKSFVESILILD